MPYNSSGLSAISYANGFTMWHYRTEDASQELATTGYFDAAHKMLRLGDFMLVNADLASKPHHHIVVVLGNEGGRVVVSDLFEFGRAIGN